MAIVQHVQAPGTYIYSLFLAGGMTKWRKEALEIIEKWDVPVIVYNPERENYDDTGIETLIEQTTWEYNALRGTDGVLFWFPEESLCTISLLELGGQLELRDNASLFVGCDPNYLKKTDLEVQISLHFPIGPELCFSLEEVLDTAYTNIKITLGETSEDEDE